MIIQNDEKALELFKDSFFNILDKINDPLIFINKDGIVIYVNSAYEYQVGIPREKILYRNLKEKHPEDKLLKVLETGQPIKEYAHYNKTLGYDIIADFIPLKDAAGIVQGVIGVGNANVVYKINRHLQALVVGGEGKTRQRTINAKNLDAFKDIISDDPKMLHCLNIAASVARTDASVMLRGETGTGKELIADAIHRASNRSDSPFVEINCAAIPENLLESELFGYVSGAFTGARATGKKGKIEKAHNGTLFLDEIGDIPLGIQVKLLRFTQEKYIERLGETKKIPVNTRIISATNRNLEQMIQQRDFRIDLFYRLNVVPIFVPPLGERITDISLLSYHFLDHYTTKYNKKLSFTPDAIKQLQDYPWPGNVRELKNVVEQAVILCQTDKITISDLRLNFFDTTTANKPFTLHLGSAVEALEKKIITEALARTKNNKSRAIDYLGISRSAFYAKLKKYNIPDQ
ncbi:MAG TPA: sigma 54-interacting transcriptional regulator [Firmicutes bacterium]|jgi:transcriptional regulator with PAS, ATPase and Fis domain|nr:sigma 54-interacting transcriptional regulator [Bacillota bacterium]